MATKTYPTRKLGLNGPAVSAIGFGAMGKRQQRQHNSIRPGLQQIRAGIGALFYGHSDREESFKTLTYAADRGVTFWDTADIYGESKYCVVQPES